MRTPRLFSDQPLVVGADVVLNESAAQYLGKVLRARVGDRVILFDGQGTARHGNHQSHGQTLRYRRSSVPFTSPQTESSLQTHLGLCLSKGDRFDWAIQKATELGVSTISPLYSDAGRFHDPHRAPGKATRPLATHRHQRLRAIWAGAYPCTLTRPPR